VLQYVAEPRYILEARVPGRVSCWTADCLSVCLSAFMSAGMCVVLRHVSREVLSLCVQSVKLVLIGISPTSACTPRRSICLIIRELCSTPSLLRSGVCIIVCHHQLRGTRWGQITPNSFLTPVLCCIL